MRSAVISATVYLASMLWPASGLLPITVKLTMLGGLVPLLFLLLAEFRPSERQAIIDFLRRRSPVPDEAGI
jgi:hypothetical protein